ncbi:MAG: hypothetical protein ACT4TC_15965 [Myxococcaceae bacterium]
MASVKPSQGPPVPPPKGVFNPTLDISSLPLGSKDRRIAERIDTGSKPGLLELEEIDAYVDSGALAPDNYFQRMFNLDSDKDVAMNMRREIVAGGLVEKEQLEAKVGELFSRGVNNVSRDEIRKINEQLTRGVNTVVRRP